MDLYRVEVGRADGVEVRHIVGAIANEGDINSRYIGHIKLYDDYSTIELPQGMPKELLQVFGKTRILNKQMRMTFVGEVHGYERGYDRDSDKRKGRSNSENRFGKPERKFKEKRNRTFSERTPRERRERRK